VLQRLSEWKSRDGSSNIQGSKKAKEIRKILTTARRYRKILTMTITESERGDIV
jgi:hypothetical protein